MSLVKPSLKYWIFILALAGAIFGVIFASVAGSWICLSRDEQQIVSGLAEKILPFPLFGSIVLFLVIGGLVSLLFRYYIIPILRLAEATRLISLANSHYRITPEGSREVIRLAEVINASADAYQKLQKEVDDAISSSQADLKEERNRFAALMSELPLGVLVCNIDGRILLYNQQAQSLLSFSVQSGITTAGDGGCLGLGRSVFGIIQREPIVNALKVIQEAVVGGQPLPTTGFVTNPETGNNLRITMAPTFSFRCQVHDECVQCERRQMTGFVLTLEGMPPACGTSDRQLPVPASGSEVLPARTASPASRPVYYEFNLFNQQGLQELGNQPLRKLTYVVFDTETTGLNPAQGDEIIQIGAIRIINGRILHDEVVDQLVDPKRSISAASVAIHGITNDMVSGQPAIEQVLPYFHRFVEGAVLVAHNAAFDMRCLQLKEQKAGVRFENPVLDTLLLSTIVHPNQEAHSIDGIADRLHLAVVGRHTALGDALVTAEVLLKLIPLLEAQGIITLEDALRASRKSPYAKLAY